MSKNKIYAVQNGKVPGLYYSWDDCKLQIDGFSNAIYKSFKGDEEKLALSYVNGDIEVKSKGSKNVYYTILNGHEVGVFDNWDKVRPLISNYPGAKYKGFKDEKIANLAFESKNLDIMSVLLEKEFKNKYDYVIFTDGGSNQDRVGAFAFIILEIENKEIKSMHDFSKGYEDVTNNRMEMKAVYEALSYLSINKIENKNIGFYIDSKFTIESINGRYNQSTLKDLADSLYTLYDVVSNKNNIELNHVNSHIGLKYNEEVDKLLNLEKENVYYKIENDRIINDYSDI